MTDDKEFDSVNHRRQTQKENVVSGMTQDKSTAEVELFRDYNNYKPFKDKNGIVRLHPVNKELLPPKEKVKTYLPPHNDRPCAFW